MSRLLVAIGMTFTAAGCSPPPVSTGVQEPTDLSRARAAAVEQTIKSRPECTALPAFYWEIGDKDGPLVSGSVGLTFTSSTRMNVASASKLVWGAYVVERFKDNVDAIDYRAMSMQSGYTSLTYASCVDAATVQDCLSAGRNGQLTPSAVDRFFYNGGHFQKHAADLGLGALGNSALAAEVKKYIGAELDLGYSSPQPAAGIQTTATDYAAFLRKLLAGQLALWGKLGARPVCTLASACPTALSSPSPYAWHYSYGHWVEDEPDTGDGAFSSPGAFGFYPWIDASRTYYGILARYSLSAQAYLESAACGRLLRKAFLSGTPQ